MIYDFIFDVSKNVVYTPREAFVQLTTQGTVSPGLTGIADNSFITWPSFIDRVFNPVSVILKCNTLLSTDTNIAWFEIYVGTETFKVYSGDTMIIPISNDIQGIGIKSFQINPLPPTGNENILEITLTDKVYQYAYFQAGDRRRVRGFDFKRDVTDLRRNTVPWPPIGNYLNPVPNFRIGFYIRRNSVAGGIDYGYNMIDSDGNKYPLRVYPTYLEFDIPLQIPDNTQLLEIGRRIKIPCIGIVDDANIPSMDRKTVDGVNTYNFKEFYLKPNLNFFRNPARPSHGISAGDSKSKTQVMRFQGIFPVGTRPYSPYFTGTVPAPAPYNSTYLILASAVKIDLYYKKIRYIDY